MKKLYFAGLCVLFLLVAAAFCFGDPLSDQNTDQRGDGNCPPPGPPPGPPWMEQLTEDQRGELKELMVEKLNEWGIEVSEEELFPPPPGPPPCPEWMDSLTDEQKDELRELKKDITRDKLTEWGIEFSEDELCPPCHPPGPPPGPPPGDEMNQEDGDVGHHGHHGPEWMDKLTEEQREEFKEAMTAFAKEKLSEWGIEVPEDELSPCHPPGPPPGEMDGHHGHHGPEWMDKLTEDQRKELMDAIFQATDEKLKEWGVDTEGK